MGSYTNLFSYNIFNYFDEEDTIIEDREPEPIEFNIEYDNFQPIIQDFQPIINLENNLRASSGILNEGIPFYNYYKGIYFKDFCSNSSVEEKLKNKLLKVF